MARNKKRKRAAEAHGAGTPADAAPASTPSAAKPEAKSTAGVKSGAAASEIDDIFGAATSARAGTDSHPQPAAKRLKTDTPGSSASTSTPGASTSTKKKKSKLQAGEVAGGRSNSSSSKPRGEGASAENPLGSASVNSTPGPGWKDDGLGGVHDTSGFTNRVLRGKDGAGGEISGGGGGGGGGGLKIYKAHLIPERDKKGAGTTPQCPFDCDCCFGFGEDGMESFLKSVS